MITLRNNHSGLFKIWLEVALIIFLSFNIFLLGSLAATGALFVVFIWWLIQFLRTRIKPALIILIAVILIAAFSIIVYTNPFHNEKLRSLKEKGLTITDDEVKRNLLSIRLAKWVSHVEIFKKHPVFGITPGDIEQERKQVYAKRGFKELLVHNYNAHNEYLEILCRFGIVGFIIYIGFLASGFSNGGSKQLYLPFIIATSIICLTESYLEVQLGLISFMGMFSILTKKIETAAPE